MSLAAGTHLGPYKVVALIGAGGMGEVYRAHDLRLGRDVAVKVLPTSFAADPERLRRFEQEARAVASLSHPNILAVHDIGQQERQHYMVVELLEGESLREVLARGPLSQRKAIDYAVQIAHGLAAAHSKNIAHRDLKPDNLFLTREGRIKILDFGLAKTVQKSIAVAPEDVPMTALGPATEVGAVIGTAGYMSPEQVRGDAIDGRSDIFSFGVVLYEMLTGVRAFKRDTTAETMTAILKEEPPELSLSAPAIAPALERTVRHCLEKAPEQRFQSARDLAFDLESFSTLTPASGTLPARRRFVWHWWHAVAAALLLIPALAAWKLFANRSSGSTRFRQVTYRRGEMSDARYSPDQRNILYTAAFEGGKSEIYTVGAKAIGGHALGIPNARLLAVSAQGELAVALSPQKAGALLTPGDLARTFGDSGAPKPEIANIQAADFLPNGNELAIARWVPAQRSTQVEYPIGKVLYRAPAIEDLRFSPDGKYLAFLSHQSIYDDRGVVVILRSSGETVRISPIFESLQGLAWSRRGDEVWFSSPLDSGDVHAMTLSGKIRLPLEVPGRLRLLDVGADGQLLVTQGISRRGMVAATHNGEAERDVSWLGFSFGRAISNDGKMVLFEEEGSGSIDYTVFVRNTDGSPAVPIGEGYGLAISPDKTWALAQKLVEPAPELWLLPIGPGEKRRLNPPNLIPFAAAATILPDAQHFLYVAHEKDRRPRTWLQSIDGGKPRPLTEEGTLGWLVSPDGRWLVTGVRNAYTSLKNPMMVPMAGGPARPMAGAQPDDNVLGWTSDGLVYITPGASEASAGLPILKLNPITGARTPWRDLPRPAIRGVFAEPPLITPNGESYLYNYSLLISDMYTIDGVR